MTPNFQKALCLLCKNLDPIIESWLNGSLSNDEFPFLLVDALHLKTREDGRVRSRGIMISAGINSDGYRDTLGTMIWKNTQIGAKTMFLEKHLR